MTPSKSQKPTTRSGTAAHAPSTSREAQAAFTILADGVANPANIAALMEAAALFQGSVALRPGATFIQEWAAAFPDIAPPPFVDAGGLAAFAPRIALDNLRGAVSVFDAHAGAGPAPALLVGNEQRGLTPAFQSAAMQSIVIPMRSPNVSTLNVAAAAATALWFLTVGRQGRRRGRGGGPLPEVLFLDPRDHVELGCSIRSAAALGWQRVFVADRFGVWFDAPRAVVAEGRAAARRHKNSIRVIPVPDPAVLLSTPHVIVTPYGGAPSIQAVRLQGPGLLVFADDGAAIAVGSRATTGTRQGRAVLPHEATLVSLGQPRTAVPRLRFTATIALAEVARRYGPAPATQPVTRPGLGYEYMLDALDQPGEVWTNEELARF